MINKLLSVNPVVVALFAMVAFEACFERQSDRRAVTCDPGISDVCYSGPAETADIGNCKRGQLFCWEENGTINQICINETLPSQEKCNAIDDDCDGLTDEDGICGFKADMMFRPGRIGPAFVTRDSGVAFHECDANETTRNCALGILKSSGNPWGVRDPENELEAIGGESPDDTGVLFLQRHKNVPVEGRWIRFSRATGNDIRGNAIVSIRANLAALDENITAEPALSSGDVITPLASGGITVEQVTLVFHEVTVDDEESSPEFKLTWRISYIDSTGDTLTSWYDASTGELLQTSTRTLMDMKRRLTDSDTGNVWDESTGQTPPTGGITRDAWNTMESWTDFLTDPGYAKATNGPANTDLDSAIHFNVLVNFRGGCCAPAAANRCGGFNNRDGDHICAGSYTDEVLAHEMGHFLVDRYWGDSNRYECKREHDAMVETFSQILAEFWQCSIGDCSFMHSGRVNFEPTFNMTQMRAERSTCIEEVRTIGDEKVTIIGGMDTKYDDARVPGSALQDLYEYLQDDGLKSRMALNTVIAIVEGALPELGSSSEMSGEPQHLEFFDFYSALLTSCQMLAGKEVMISAEGETRKVNFQDCSRILGAFAGVGVVAACENPEPFDFCNGIDDDCDGFTDECNSYEDCCAPIDKSKLGDTFGPGQCNWLAKLTEPNSLVKWCYSGTPESTAGVGECRSGYRTCSNGRLSPTCFEQVVPTNEVCDSETLGTPAKDENCNGIANEISVKDPYIFDADNDGYHGPYNPQLFCPDDVPDRFVPDSPVVDCDDLDSTIHPPDILENDYPGYCDGIDNDCDAITDEGCICTPWKDLPRPCGPSTNSPKCISGVQKCAWDRDIKEYVWESICTGDEWGYSEVCDGVDNDCNGAIDDNPIDIDPEEYCLADTGVGWCGLRGHFRCTNGSRVCVKGTPIAEQCDWEDRDCDGTPGVLDASKCIEKISFPTVPTVHPSDLNFDGEYLDDSCHAVMDYLHLVNGDCEMYGVDGEQTIGLEFEVFLSYSGRCLTARIYMKFIERKGDYSTGELTKFITKCTSKEIVGLEGNAHYAFSYNLPGNSDWWWRFREPLPYGDSLIHQLVCMGDTEGDDICGERMGAGSGAGCEVTFNPVGVRVLDL